MTLDAVVLDRPSEQLILTIDIEGNELDLLGGASRLQPKCWAVLFESWESDPNRGANFDQLREAGFRLMAIDADRRHSRALGRQDFVASPAANFLAART